MRLLCLVVTMLVSQLVFADDVNTYLEKYAWNNDFQKVEKLLKKGANPNKDYRLLWQLITADRLEMADLLIKYGGKIKYKDGTSYLLSDSLHKWGRVGRRPMGGDCQKALGITKYLLSKGHKLSDTPPVLHSVSRMKDKNGKRCIKLAKYLLDNGGRAMVNSIVADDVWGNLQSPFYTAVGEQNYQIAKLFVEYDLDPNNPVSRPKNGTGETPLTLVAWKGNVELAKLLINKGAKDIEAAKQVSGHLGFSEGKEVREYLILEY